MKSLEYKFNVGADLATVWRTLTTSQGIRAFFSPNFNIDFQVGGPFEIYFDMDQAEGMRGSEEMIILSMTDKEMLSFTWNNPPSLANIRGQMTVVQIYLSAVDQSTSEIHFIHSGFAATEDWVKSYGYFQRAWGQIVLPNLKYALEVEPVNWHDRQAIAQIDYK